MFRPILKRTLFFITVVGIVLISGVALAHPPSAVNLSYDKDAKLLKITVLHSVPNPTGDHFVKQVTVKLNGIQVVLQNFLSQSGNGEQVVQYVIIDAKPGDSVEVQAFCSKFGDNTNILKIQ
ncbi:MAG: hypothetical protein WCP87_01130 [Atribacterota bacterium]|nr:hypothetical protein [Candidatus Atribacteria bacterium]